MVPVPECTSDDSGWLPGPGIGGVARGELGDGVDRRAPNASTSDFISIRSFMSTRKSWICFASGSVIVPDVELGLTTPVADTDAGTADFVRSIMRMPGGHHGAALACHGLAGLGVWWR